MNRILFVDDNEHYHNKLHELFTKIGNSQIDLVGFAFGRDLIEHYREQIDMGQKIDLLLIDVVMTDMHGFDTLKEIMKINASAQVAMMTGVSRRNVIDGLKLGAKGFIWKPFDETNVTKVFNKLVLRTK